MLLCIEGGNRAPQTGPKVSGHYVFGSGVAEKQPLSLDTIHALKDPILALEKTALGLVQHVDFVGMIH